METTSTLVSGREQSAAPQRKASFYRPELDILRFFAFFAVLMFHTTDFSVAYFTERHLPLWLAKVATEVSSAGARGVDLFFVLSAYLITELLLREKEQTGSLNVKSFYIRRILRIWPLYYFFILLTFFVPFLNPWHTFTWKYLAAFLLLSGNWIGMFLGPTGAVADVLWSVSVEEQFYLLWPPVVARLSRRSIGYAAILMIVIACLTRSAIILLHGSFWEVWCNTFARLDTIGCGILLAVLLHGQMPRLKLTSRLFFVCLGIVTIIFTAYLRPAGGHLSWLDLTVSYPLAAASCMGIVFAVLGMELRSRPLEYLGKISYGLYVYHLVCLRITDKFLHFGSGLIHMCTRPLITLAITIIFAAISYRFLETPFLKLKRRFTYISSRPV